MENQRVVITEYGQPSTLKLISEPIPLPQAGEVRIRVEAAGVSFGDVLQRVGLFFAGAPKMPYSPGYDVVGTVDAVGEQVKRVRIGDRVASLPLFGGYARYLCVPENYIVTGVPPELDAAGVVALVLNYTTAFQMMHRVAGLLKGQSMLAFGASGGVGSALLDLGNHMGLKIAAAVSKKWHKSFSGQAHFLFEEKTENSQQSLLSFQPGGFDAVFDPIGGTHVWNSRKLVAKGGKLVACGISSAVKPNGGRDRSQVLRLGLLLAFSKVCRSPNVELYALDQRIKTKRQEINQDIRTLIDLYSQGLINPRIGATFTLADAHKAHELIESRNNIGKIVLIP